MTENPWISRLEQPLFVLPQDRDKVLAFNATQGKHRLELSLIPQPFLGRPDAPLVLLGNIAGVSETGDEPPAPYTQNPAYMDRMRRNLRHDLAEDYPFAGLDPGIVPPDKDWWAHKLKYILDEFTNKEGARSLLAMNVLAVEFFPYVSYSNRYAHDGLSVPSQAYSRALAHNALKQDAVIALKNGVRVPLGDKPVIVFRHGEKRWQDAVPHLREYPRLVQLKNYRKGLVSRNNCCGDGWSLIQQVIRQIEAAAARAGVQ